MIRIVDAIYIFNCLRNIHITLHFRATLKVKCGLFRLSKLVWGNGGLPSKTPSSSSSLIALWTRCFSQPHPDLLHLMEPLMLLVCFSYCPVMNSRAKSLVTHFVTVSQRGTPSISILCSVRVVGL